MTTYILARVILALTLAAGLAAWAWLIRRDRRERIADMVRLDRRLRELKPEVRCPL